MNRYTFKSYISIHALRVEGDSQTWTRKVRRALFLSTPSGWRATSFSSHSSHGVAISIHALRVEGDYRGPARP